MRKRLTGPRHPEKRSKGERVERMMRGKQEQGPGKWTEGKDRMRRRGDSKFTGNAYV